jgi:CRISPR-associated protein Csd1
MLLTKLYDYATNQMPFSPSMYDEKDVHWIIELKSDGRLNGTFTSLIEKVKGKKFGKSYVLPHLGRSSTAIRPRLLADNGEYVLGIPKSGRNPVWVEKAHQEFIELTKRCAHETQEPYVQSIVKFLESWKPDQISLHLPPGFNADEFDPGDRITFRVDNVIPIIEITSLQKFWADHTATFKEKNKSNVSSQEPLRMQCLVTGEYGSVEQRLPFKIKGIPDGDSSGTSLVSANDPSFESYKLKNSLTSPICRKAGEGFAKALNHLIATKESRLYMGSVVYVFWTKEKAEYDFWDFLKEDQPGEVRNLLNSMRSGERVHELADNQFYALGLSASGGRAVVRDWIESTILDAIQNLDYWFEAQEMVDSHGGSPEKPYLSVYHLSDCLYRDPRKETIARIPPLLIQAALKGIPLPNSLLVQVVRRICVDRTKKNDPTTYEYPVTHARAVLIKLILTSQKKVSMTNMQSLNLNPDLEPQDKSAYHCGRLLAQLEIIQREAQGKDINATLIDRYYGAASATPGKVLGSLVEKSQAHLTKIRKDRRNVYEALQRQLEEIMTYLSPEAQYFPRTLTMQQQSIFALGYYHQRAENRRAAIAASKANKEKAAVAQSDD